MSEGIGAQEGAECVVSCSGGGRYRDGRTHPRKMPVAIE